MKEKTFICSCCNPSKSYVNKRALRKHQQKYDADYVFGGETNLNRERYDNCPPKCKQCSEPIEYSKEVFTKTFCNRLCSNKFNNNRLGTGKCIRKSNFECARCKKISTRTISTKIYCSQLCKNEMVVVNWKNKPSSATNSSGSLHRTVRAYLLKKTNHKCSKCGWGEINTATGNVPIQIDHIDGDYMNNSPDNLRVLCPNCHSLTHNYGSLNKGGREYRREYRAALRSEVRKNQNTNALTGIFLE